MYKQGKRRMEIYRWGNQSARKEPENAGLYLTSRVLRTPHTKYTSSVRVLLRNQNLLWILKIQRTEFEGLNKQVIEEPRKQRRHGKATAGIRYHPGAGGIIQGSGIIRAQKHRPLEELRTGQWAPHIEARNSEGSCLVRKSSHPGQGKRRRNTDFPLLEHSYKIFHKPKCHKVKKQSPLLSMEKFFNIPRPKNISSLGLFWCLRTHLANDTQNKSR